MRNQCSNDPVSFRSICLDSSPECFEQHVRNLLQIPLFALVILFNEACSWLLIIQ